MFKRILLGIVIISFSPRIMGVSILPDFIGYILIFSGLSGVAHFHPKLEKAKTFSFALIFLSLPTVYEYKVDFDKVNSISQIGGWFIFSLIISLIAMVFYYMFAYNLYMGIHDLALSRKISLLAYKAESAWKYIIISVVFAVIMIFFMFIMVFAILASSGGLGAVAGILVLLVILIVIAFIINIVALVFQIQTLLEASRVLEGPNSEGSITKDEVYPFSEYDQQ